MQNFFFLEPAIQKESRSTGAYFFSFFFLDYLLKSGSRGFKGTILFRPNRMPNSRNPIRRSPFRKEYPLGRKTVGHSFQSKANAPNIVQTKTYFELNPLRRSVFSPKCCCHGPFTFVAKQKIKPIIQSISKRLTSIVMNSLYMAAEQPLTGKAQFNNAPHILYAVILWAKVHPMNRSKYVVLMILMPNDLVEISLTLNCTRTLFNSKLHSTSDSVSLM